MNCIYFLFIFTSSLCQSLAQCLSLALMSNKIFSLSYRSSMNAFTTLSLTGSCFASMTDTRYHKSLSAASSGSANGWNLIRFLYLYNLNNVSCSSFSALCFSMIQNNVSVVYTQSLHTICRNRPAKLIATGCPFIPHCIICIYNICKFMHNFLLICQYTWTSNIFRITIFVFVFI